MSFRKRNTVLSASASAEPSQAQNPALVKPAAAQLSPGLRPSPYDGRLTTSTGTASLDTLLAGHAALPLGNSLLVEEQGTTDFAGAILRYYAAEGLVQGHSVHVLGFGDAWKFELPGLASESDRAKTKRPAVTASEDKMKIAWRYEALSNRSAQSLPVREKEGASMATFCHSFELSKRLASADIKGSCHGTPLAGLTMNLSSSAASSPSPLKAFIKKLQAHMASSPPSSIHRIVIPNLLSPTLYSSDACHPSEVLQFLHSLRALLRRYPRQLTAMLSLSTSLFPRTAGLTRWIELLCDGAIELIPLPPETAANPTPAKGDKDKDAEKVQGMVRVYTLPVYHEKGGGGAGGNHFRENLSFSLSASRGMVIKPYSLPPMEDEEHHEKSPASTIKDSIDF